jgi:protein-disulfide isomerase
MGYWMRWRSWQNLRDTMSHIKPPVDGTDHIQGSNTAPVTLVEYGDFQCSFCGRAYPLVKAAQEALAGNLRFVFRNFPISTIHPNAENAAEAAEIAAGSGKFWQYHDLLYENQEALDPANLVDYAVQLGMERDTFTNQLQSHAKSAEVRKDFMSGVRSGVNGTPTFFINGSRFDGNWDHRGLIKALQTVLSELEKPKV